MKRNFFGYGIREGPNGELEAYQDGKFTGVRPRNAATKIASRGKKLILLRESRTNKIHVYTGSTKTIPAPDGAPAWTAGKLLKRGLVKKVGVLHFKTFDDIIPQLPAKLEALMGE